MQDYNTPPLQGLDGEIYQPGTVDYHAAMTELLLHGFNVGGDPKQFFPPMPADKVAVGFLTGDTTPTIVSQAMDYIITGKAPAGTHVQAAQAGRLPRHDRRDVLDDRRRPPRELQLLQRRRSAAPRLSGGEVGGVMKAGSMGNDKPWAVSSTVFLRSHRASRGTGKTS